MASLVRVTVVNVGYGGKLEGNGDMTVKNFIVNPCDIKDIKEFVENWHYSSNVNGLRVSQCFNLLRDNQLIGGMIYGGFGMANAWKKYANKEDDVVELRRLCCVDDTPKNTESYFIGRSIKWLLKNTNYKTIVSYADSHYGHEGIIYKASNFKHVGMTSKTKVIHFDGKQYHDKSIRTYYTDKFGNKRLKPFAQRIKDALSVGEAYYSERPPKHIYLYDLETRRKW